MKTILCFGDSNTWGFIPGSEFERYSYEKRIPGALQKLLGANFRVIEEALNGRMIAWDDPLNADKNGKSQLPFILDSHRPLDFISIMLGTNDLKHYMGLQPKDCATAIGVLVEIINNANCGPNNKPPKILIISPPKIVPSSDPFGNIFDEAPIKSAQMPAEYEKIANRYGCLFMDAALEATTPDTDGIHIDEKGHYQIAFKISEIIKENI